MAIVQFPVKLSYTPSGGPGYNIWGIRTTDAIFSQTQLDALSSHLHQFYTDITGVFPTSMTMAFEGAVRVYPLSGGEVESSPPWTVSGADVANAYAPTAAAICLTLRSTLSTRSTRGRKFLSPVAQDAVQSDGTVTASVLSVLRTAAATLVSSYSGSGDGAIGIYSEKLKTMADVTAVTITDQFAVLRSRRD